jgi:hypothetical protein
VDQTLIGGDLGIDADPKPDVTFQLGGVREGIAWVGRRRMAWEARTEKQSNQHDSDKKQIHTLEGSCEQL